MRKPETDYRELKSAGFGDPRFSHLKLIPGWLVFLLFFALTERYIPLERCHVMHCRLDDIIPFCEIFVVPYVLWYLFIAGSLIYFLFYSVESFKRLQICIFLLQAVSVVIFIAFPTAQNLRPAVFPRQNIFTALIGGLYAVDTNTGVCPSLHVAVSIAIASAWVKDKTANTAAKAAAVVFAFTVCLSVVFIKQHSVIDCIAALPICLLGEIVVYGKSYWAPKFKKSKSPR